MTTQVAITDFCAGDELELDHRIVGLLKPVATATLGLEGANPPVTWTVTPTPAPVGVVLDPGTVQSDGTYTAEVIFVLTGGVGGDTLTNFPPGVITEAYLNVLCDDGSGPYTAEVLQFIPTRGGQYG